MLLDVVVERMGGIGVAILDTRAPGGCAEHRFPQRAHPDREAALAHALVRETTVCQVRWAEAMRPDAAPIPLPGEKLMNALLRPAYLRGAGDALRAARGAQRALDLMDEAAALAIDRSGLQRSEVDGVLCGYATTLPLRCTPPGVRASGPRSHYAHGMQLGVLQRRHA